MQKNDLMKLGMILFTVSLFTVSVTGQTFEWKKAVPEEVGLSTSGLNALRDTLARHGTAALLVIRKDRIALEWYAEGRDESTTHYTASLSKALVGGLSLLLALDDGRLGADDPASRYIPQWRNDPVRSKITIRQLATHTSGVEDAEMTDREISVLASSGVVINDRHMDLPGWKGNFWRQKPDPFTMARDSAPIIYLPGTRYHYSNPGMALLSYAITSAYRGTDVRDIRTLLKERIFDPIGIISKEWQIGYAKTFSIDGLELVPNWGGGSLTPQAVARIGRLMLNKGSWDGRQLIDPELIKLVTAYAGMPVPARGPLNPDPASGLCWYTNYDGVWQYAPRDLFAGSGAGNQTLIVIPSLDMIIVRNGRNMYDPAKGEGHFYGVEKLLVNQIMDALIDPPYPQSNFIKGVRFARQEEIIRLAEGSDNWPSTWADDDALYSAYGDGWGFEPKIKEKLSLGLVKVDGNPPAVAGTNIRSETGEQVGQGRYGIKASGMLMVEGRLYMWLRNADRNGRESEIAWSDDRGNTWKKSDWRFTEGFGCPAFLNFGKDYSGARDRYVYIYSFDEADAYKPADRFVLARVRKDRIHERQAYEFFVEVRNGRPLWSREIGDRGPVFENPAGCYRSGISYNRGLGRYLWCQVLPYSTHPQGTRFEGGFGIYEAPEPWGPWRTVYYTRKWDVGPGETSSIPPKWMSSDGKTCWLLFSGDDCFSLRKIEFVTK
jgi:CubicO group peptidase (beta-lactamase class C family)